MNSSAPGGSEAELVNIACSALHIRDPRAHVPLSLAATCQPCSVSLKAGRSTYNALHRSPPIVAPVELGRWPLMNHLAIMRRSNCGRAGPH